MYKKLLLSLLCCTWLVPVFGMSNLTAYAGTLMKREDATKIFDINNIKRISSGGLCTLYSLGNHRALRVSCSVGKNYIHIRKFIGN